MLCLKGVWFPGSSQHSPTLTPAFFAGQYVVAAKEFHLEDRETGTATVVEVDTTAVAIEAVPGSGMLTLLPTHDSSSSLDLASPRPPQVLHLAFNYPFGWQGRTAASK